MAADRSDRINYALFLRGAGAFYDARINDVTVWRDFQAAPASQGLPINQFLKSGTNTISVTLVTVMGDPFVYNAANPDFFFEAELDQRPQGAGSGGALQIGFVTYQSFRRVECKTAPRTAASTA